MYTYMCICSFEIFYPNGSILYTLYFTVHFPPNTKSRGHLSDYEEFLYSFLLICFNYVDSIVWVFPDLVNQTLMDRYFACLQSFANLILLVFTQ